VPATATVPANADYVRFIAYSKTGVPSQTVTLTSTYGGSGKTANISVTGSTTAAVQRAANTEPVPVIQSVVNAAAETVAACSPGSAVALSGKRLGSEADDEVVVEVDGQAMKVLVHSPTRVVFECPDAPVGADLDVVVRNPKGKSNPVRMRVHDVNPGIFTIDGSNDGFGSIVVGETAYLTISGPGLHGVPARPGDVISVFCTGLGRTFGSGERAAVNTPVVLIDGLAGDVLSAVAIGNGVYRVDVRVPQSVTTGTRVRLTVEAASVDGHMVSSNAVDIATVPSSRE
jgi:uncharacterized protein (TIGR03437 family)